MSVCVCVDVKKGSVGRGDCSRLVDVVVGE